MSEIPKTAETNNSLKRVLGLTSAIMLVAGTMIGTGIFKKIVPMAATGLSQNAILLAWLVAGIITLLGAFTFAGLAKLSTASGGAYEYLRICYNDLTGFLLGWACFVTVGSGAIAAVGFIFSQSINSLIHIPDPLWQWSQVSIGNHIYPFANSGIKIFALLSIVLLTWVNYKGVQKVSLLNNIITSVKIAGILLLILGGLILVSTPANQNVLTASKNISATSSLSIFLSAMLSAFWAYDGFSNVSAVAEEIKNPKRNIAIAIVSGSCIVMILYLLVNYSFIKIIPLNELAIMGENKIAATEAASKMLGSNASIFISVLIMLSTFGTLNVLILVYSRLYFRMAQENNFFKNASKVHPVYKTPHYALLYSMIWSCVLVATGTFDILTNIVVFTSFTFYTLLAIGLIKMKRKKVITEKIVLYPLAPVLFIISTLFFLINTLMNNQWQTVTGIILVASGIPFYYLFRYKNLQNKTLADQ